MVGSMDETMAVVLVASLVGWRAVATVEKTAVPMVVLRVDRKVLVLVVSMAGHWVASKDVM